MTGLVNNTGSKPVLSLVDEALLASLAASAPGDIGL
jgi:hypothetical protein